MSERERLALLAHELRSPVAALEALVHAAPGVTATEARRGLLARALAAARDLERLLSDPDLLSLRLEPVDLVATARALATDRVSVRGEGRLLVRADETRLRQALANLVANGLRHGTRVELAVEARHGSVVVEVTDDGPGRSSKATKLPGVSLAITSHAMDSSVPSKTGQQFRSIGMRGEKSSASRLAI